MIDANKCIPIDHEYVFLRTLIILSIQYSKESFIIRLNITSVTLDPCDLGHYNHRITTMQKKKICKYITKQFVYTHTYAQVVSAVYDEALNESTKANYFVDVNKKRE